MHLKWCTQNVINSLFLQSFNQENFYFVYQFWAQSKFMKKGKNFLKRCNNSWIFSPAKSCRVLDDIVVGIAVVVKGLFFCLTRIFTRPALPEVSGFEPRPRLLIISFSVSIASVVVVVVDVVVDLKKSFIQNLVWKWIRNLSYTRKYPLRGYILGVLTHTTAWDQLWGGDIF